VVAVVAAYLAAVADLDRGLHEAFEDDIVAPR
jgi:hypothetical protein